MRILVTGAGGFIGHHFVKTLKECGHWVRGVDLKYPEFEKTSADDFQIRDLRSFQNCWGVTWHIDQIFHFAANMGGIGYITYHHAEVMRDNTLIDTYMIEAARQQKVDKFFYASSACVYPMYTQVTPEAVPLKESDAYPADSEDGYGWEKLFAEQQCRHYLEDFGLQTYVARLHNVFGPKGSFTGGKEKSPAAICRKIALADDGDSIEVWGNGKQTRSYCYIDDCIEGIFRIVESDYHEPLNLGSDRLVSLDELVDIVANIAGKKIGKVYNLSQPVGAIGRNSDNTLIKKVLGWAPSITLEEGLIPTYNWIHSMVRS